MLIVFGIFLSLLMMAVGCALTLKRFYVQDTRKRAEQPGYETRTLSEPVARCGVAKCYRLAVEFDGDRHMYVCIVHRQAHAEDD